MPGLRRLRDEAEAFEVLRQALLDARPQHLDGNVPAVSPSPPTRALCTWAIEAAATASPKDE